MARVLLRVLLLTSCSTLMACPAWAQQCVRSWGSGNGSGDGEFTFAYAIALDQTGRVFVSDMYNYRIQVFTQTGTFLYAWPTTGGRTIHMGLVALPSGNLLAAFDPGYIAEYTTAGDLVREWGSAGSEPGQFFNPKGIAVLDDTVFVADTDNNRIQALLLDGTFVRQWGREGHGPGEFGGPFDVAADPAGFVYVADRANGRIQRFTTTGSYVAEWGGFAMPYGVSMGVFGSLFVADTGNHRVVECATDGTVLNTWTGCAADGGFLSVVDAVQSPDGLVYAVSNEGARVQVLADAPTPNRRHAWGDVKALYR